MKDLRYPIGEFKKPGTIRIEDIDWWINDIAQLPDSLRKEVENLSEHESNWQYRPGSWNVRQLVHHCADSHINGFIRFKLAITEEKPTIKPYLEDKWSALPDAQDSPISWSLELLDGLHRRWAYMLKHFNSHDFKKVFIHPEHNQEFSVEEGIGVYAWHGNHHLGHVRQAKAYEGRFDNSK